MTERSDIHKYSIVNLQSSIPVYPGWETSSHTAHLILSLIYPDAAKAGGLQSQGVKVEIVVGYIDPLTTQDLKSSGFPVG